MSRYVGYDHDPLPPDRFRLSFGPPKRQAKPQPKPAPVPPAPKPVIATPRPRLVEPPPPPPAELRQPAPPPRPARPPAPPTPPRILRPQLEPRGSQVQEFPTWKPQAAPVLRLPERPVEAVVEAAAALPEWQVLALRIVAALVLMAPLGWLGGWLMLPGTPEDFLMTAPGRVAWRAFGGPDGMVVYWFLLAPFAFAATYLRPLAGPLAGLVGMYWAWSAAHHLLGTPPPFIPW